MAVLKTKINGNWVKVSVPLDPTREHTYRGAVGDLGYTSFSDCTLEGYYTFTTEDITIGDDNKITITDAPADLKKAGICCVYKALKLGINFQYITDLDGNMWTRQTRDGVWTSINSNYRGAIGNLGYTAFSQCTQDGYYDCTATYIPIITDKPAGLVEQGCICSVYTHHYPIVTKIQHIMDLSGHMWYRIGLNSSWTEINVDATSDNFSQLRWCALGDSITEGWYSYYDENNIASSNNANKTSAGWAYKCANICGYTLNNQAIGGTGYAYSNPNNSDSKNAKTLVDELLATNFNYFKDYDFVTLAYGVNDWKYGCQLGSMTDYTTEINTYTDYIRSSATPFLSKTPVKSITKVVRNGEIIYSDTVANANIESANTQFDSSEQRRNSGALYNLSTDDGYTFQAGDEVTYTYTKNIPESSEGDRIIPNMRYVIERILESNPRCKIFVITPLNCVLSAGGTNSAGGAGSHISLKSDNYALGYKITTNNTELTLEQVFSAIKEVCEYYDIEMIDMTHSSVINRENILSLLVDNIHPTEEAHTAIASELAAKINVK